MRSQRRWLRILGRHLQYGREDGVELGPNGAYNRRFDAVKFAGPQRSSEFNGALDDLRRLYRGEFIQHGSLWAQRRRSDGRSPVRSYIYSSL